jgi:indolepyruvate ferredoxin oxidoreductase beta subunit
MGENMEKKYDLIMVGIGGQGIVLASDILGEVAMTAGYDIKKTDTLGMAQRGGSVVSNIRIAEHVWSPLIMQGTADFLIAFEKLEALRWCPYLRPNGTVILNNQVTPPLSASLGVNRYPDDQEIYRTIRQVTDHIYTVQGSQSVIGLGDFRTLNMFMLGCISHFIPIEIKVWEECIRQRLPAKILGINLTAFNKGREEISYVNI